jgi:hypothetical protein
MLKTNSKIFRNKVKQFIIDNYDSSNYDEGSPEAMATTLPEIAKIIFAECKRVESYQLEHYRSYTMQNAFDDWVRGLPTEFSCQFFLGIAVDVLGDMLEQTQAEREKYSQSQAEDLLIYVMYRELSQAVEK